MKKATQGLSLFLIGLGIIALPTFVLAAPDGIALNSGNVGSVCSQDGLILDCSSKSITSIAPDTFVDYSGVDTLYFSNNQISSISSGVFNGLSNVQTLYFMNNQLESIQGGAFNGLSSLQTLLIRNNQLTGIQNGAFNGLSNLYELSFDTNQLTSIESGVFNELLNLQILDFSNNQLTTIGGGIFNGLSSLTSLTISNNQLTSIQSGAFNGLSSLTSLYLTNNQLTSIQSGVFIGLSMLSDLFLDNNLITTIASGAFNGLSSTTSLYLNNNQLTTIGSGIFNGITSLTSLYITNNQLTTIESWAFNGLSSVLYLDLSNNQITTIQSSAFNGLAMLDELYLTNNQLNILSPGVFDGLGNLTRLYLDDNQLTSIQSGAFNGLLSLSRLYLTNNQLTTISTGIFNDIFLLSRLYLDNNQIVTIEDGAFDSLSLSDLSLYNNCLDTDDTALTEYLDSFAAIYAEQYVCLGVNYTPKTQTSGPVVGNLFLFGGTEAQRSTLSGENPDIGLLSHTWTENGIYSFDLSSIIDSNSYLRQLVNAQTILTGKVTWITPVDHVAEAFSGVDTALFTSGIVGNLDQVDSSNYTAFSGLTFEKRTNPADASTAVGSITFDGTLDLSDAATQAFLQNLATRFTANESGTISLDFRGISDAVSLKGASATIKFYGLDKLGFADTATSAEILAKLNVYDDNGLMLDKSALLANSGTYVGACGVGETECHVFTIGVNHFTTYKISSNTTNDNSSHGGGGGGSSVSKDTCENGDYSASYYDGICGTKPVIATGAIFIEPIADELVAAYKRAYIKDITTMDTISGARVQAFLTRGEMSKMIVNYAINILGKKIDTSKKASFKDINFESEEMKGYINKAYQLGLMGIDVINFNPQGLVTRGEFATILARLLYQEEAEGAGFYYDKPIEILRQNGIIKNTNPMMQEVRGYVMLMLMRSSQ